MASRCPELRTNILPQKNISFNKLVCSVFYDLPNQQVLGVQGLNW